MLCITKKRYLINRLRKQFEMFYVDQWEIENERQNIIKKQKKLKFEFIPMSNLVIDVKSTQIM